MRLKSVANEDDLYVNEESYFMKRYHMSVLDNSGKRIGEAFGHLIDTDKVANAITEDYESDFFVELDSSSLLLCECADYIINMLSLKKIKNTNNILFLNRLSLKKGSSSAKHQIEALDLLFENAETVIYSFGLGSTELDNDFPNYEYINPEKYKILLKDNGWEYLKEHGFYIKSRQDMWTKDKIRERLYNPYLKIQLTDKNFSFWQCLLSDISETEEETLFLEKDLNVNNRYIELRISQYDYAKSHLEIINKWKKKKNILSIDISPFTIYLFVDYISEMNEMRNSGDFIFEDNEVEATADIIIKKYYNLFKTLEKDNSTVIIYEPMIEKYFDDLDEFTRIKTKLIYNKIMNNRQYKALND